MNATARTLDDLFGVLADPECRRTVELLGRSPMRAGDLAEALSLPAPAMSRRLRALRNAGLVTESHPPDDARVRIYALDGRRLSDLKDWLAQAEGAWTAQLEALRRHLGSGA